jgi:8-oxo-dGTP pyrophosphatase MutT (NUDIX family)
VVLAVNFKHLYGVGAGGVAKPDEFKDPKKAAIREFEKETGFTIPEDRLDEVKYCGSTVTTDFRGLGPRVCHEWALFLDDESYEKVIRSRPKPKHRTEVVCFAVNCVSMRQCSLRRNVVAVLSW